MLTRFLIAGALSAAFVSPVFAQADMICDQDGLSKVETEVGAFTDATRKDYAEKELAMAKEAMAANDAEKCKTHMANALKGGSSD
ncbi:hypothetical protein [Sinorhizobium alkalisoli]|uniref:Uncharacterized protein n=1 Tax=Sinorhizobium alkalisoli TaxID=1752398 RepID=A0A1E3VHR0_9HYPH|nr:hypothetical protein [Sinorhizobium alkalisoli]MCA1491774.1 hypothetical protein [Ensifer sp. NBAIM29]MCG5479232.1 hypothetical protein [Sinorhizobium alkalisoli]ODR92396.1 hypothetical protein A8M32_04990 [Sinorhizobium alkalisoli]QFI66921.1 hypothetical protein EKH55_2047 [Sinorhizobium alkalisoli]